MEKFKTKTRRLAMYLYTLGFDKTSTYENGIEIWWFDNSEELKKSLDFYFTMRKITGDTDGKKEQSVNKGRMQKDCRDVPKGNITH